MSTTAVFGIHPLADLVPSMTDEEYVALRDDIAEHGLRDEIVLYEGKVLDGRHRLRACRYTDIEPRFTDYEGEEPASFVLSHNLHRRNLTASQKAMLAVEFLPALEEENEARRRAKISAARSDDGASAIVSDPTPLSRSEAAEKTGSAGRTVQQAKRIKDADPELAQRVLQGEVKVKVAEREVIARERGAQNGHKPIKPESGKRLPKALTRVAERLDGTLDALEGIALQKSCDGLSCADREKAAESFSRAATKFRKLANMLAAAKEQP